MPLPGKPPPYPAPNRKTRRAGPAIASAARRRPQLSRPESARGRSSVRSARFRLSSFSSSSFGAVESGDQGRTDLIARSQLRHGVAAIVRDPDVRAVEGDAEGLRADGKGTSRLFGPVARPQLRHGVAVKVRDPDVRAVESDEVGTHA